MNHTATATIVQAGRSTAAPVLGALGYRTLPAGMTPEETHRYWTGYAAGQRKYGKSIARPVAVHDTTGTAETWAPLATYSPAPGTAARVALGEEELANQARAYRTGEHPVAHAAGIAELRKYLTSHGNAGRGATLVDPATGQPVGLAKTRAGVTRKGERQDLAAFSKTLETALRTGDSWAPGKGQGAAVTFHTVPESAEVLAAVALNTPPGPVQGAPSPVAEELAPVVSLRAFLADERVSVIHVTDTPPPAAEVVPCSPFIVRAPGRYAYRAACPCGWESRGYVAKHAASTMADDHMSIVFGGWPVRDETSPLDSTSDPVETAAPVAEVDVLAELIAAADIPDPARGRRAARRAVAAAMRAAGMTPAGADWSRACELAGVLS